MFKLDLVVNDRHETYLFHNLPFTRPIKRIEIDRLDRSLRFIDEQNRPHEFGMPITEQLFKMMDGTDHVMLVLMSEETGQAISGDYYPAIVY